MSAVALLVAVTAAQAQDVSKVTVTAATSGWQMDVPATWQQDIADDPDGGTDTFTSPDGNLVVAVSTFTLPENFVMFDNLGLFEDGMFESATAHENRKVTINDTTGILRSYVFVSDGAQMVAYAYYTHPGTYAHVVWALTEADMAQQRSAEAFGVMGTFKKAVVVPPKLPEMPKADATAEQAPATPAISQPSGEAVPAGTPLQVTKLVVGSDVRPDESLIQPTEQIDATAALVRAEGHLVGSARDGTLSIALIYEDTGYVVGTHDATIAELSRENAIDVSLSVTRPDNGWPGGLYRVVVSHKGTELASKLFSVEGG